jgi:hypothetical protein
VDGTQEGCQIQYGTQRAARNSAAKFVGPGLDQLQGSLARLRGEIGHSMGGQQVRAEMISEQLNPNIQKSNATVSIST